MTEDNTDEIIEQVRVSKRDFVNRVAKRAGVPSRVANEVYDAFMGELVDIMYSGGRLTLTGVGRFYTQSHKGHRVRRIVGDGSTDAGQIDDYVTMKFTATRGLNKSIGEQLRIKGRQPSGRGDERKEE